MTAAEPARPAAESSGERVASTRRVVPGPLAVRALAIAAVLWLPIRIVAQGYLPPDDALRHAAKAVSGKPWTEILLLRPEITLDSHPGWHAILGALHAWLGFTVADLALFSVITLFATLSLGPLLILRRPEAWILALTAVWVVDSGFVHRLMLGRPFLLTSALVPLACLLWSRLEESLHRPTWMLFVVGAALSTWIHGSFYLLALPVVCLAAARRWRAAWRLAGAFALGIVLGAALTGHPLGHLQQMVTHGRLALADSTPASALAFEFRPADGRPLAVAAFLALLAWRRFRTGSAGAAWRDPVAMMVVVPWVLGFVVIRFWTDWGLPALVAFGALEAQNALEKADSDPGGIHAQRPLSRVWLTGAAGALMLIVGGSDLAGRWTSLRELPFLHRRNATEAPHLPAPGGIAYSADMDVFYALFYANPDAPWKYVLGFEPAIMRPEDYAVYKAIRTSRGNTESFTPWVRRMRPQDRLYVAAALPLPPPVQDLDWQHPLPNLWVGRVPTPRPAADGPAQPPG